MKDGLVVLGAIAIVGVVAIATVALVFDRSFGFRGSKESVEIHTTSDGNAVGNEVRVASP